MARRVDDVGELEAGTAVVVEQGRAAALLAAAAAEEAAYAHGQQTQHTGTTTEDEAKARALGGEQTTPWVR